LSGVGGIVLFSKVCKTERERERDTPTNKDYPFDSIQSSLGVSERKKMAVSMGTGLLLSSPLTLRTPRFALFSTPSSTLRMTPLRTVTSATVSQPPPTGGKIRGIMKPKKISPEMQDLVGQPEISRTQALKSIWAHIKEHNLQV